MHIVYTSASKIAFFPICFVQVRSIFIFSAKNKINTFGEDGVYLLWGRQYYK